MKLEMVDEPKAPIVPAEPELPHDRTPIYRDDVFANPYPDLRKRLELLAAQEKQLPKYASNRQREEIAAQRELLRAEVIEREEERKTLERHAVGSIYTDSLASNYYLSLKSQCHEHLTLFERIVREERAARESRV
jgi:hypothetical protein